jgi:hypothetical protein
VGDSFESSHSHYILLRGDEKAVIVQVCWHAYTTRSLHTFWVSGGAWILASEECMLKVSCLFLRGLTSDETEWYLERPVIALL